MYSWSTDIQEGTEMKDVNGRFIRVYSQRPCNLIDVFLKNAREYRAKVALIDEEVQFTYGDFDERTTYGAKRLILQNKIKKGDRVALLLKNTIGFCLATFSILKAGGIVVPINTKLKPKDWTAILNKIQPKFLIVDDDLVETLKFDSTSSVPFSGESEWMKNTAFDLFQGTMVEFPTIVEHDSAFILFTSGTTGEPKGAVLSHFNAIHACINYERCYGLISTDTTIISVPIFHGTGLFAQLVTFVYLGGTIVLLKTFDPLKMLKLCEEHRVTHTIVVPTIYTMLLNEPTYLSYDLHFRVLGSGGAALPEILLTRMTQWLPKVKIINTYGLTEATSPAIIMPHEMTLKKSGSIGIPSPVTECKVVDPQTGTEVPVDETGELWLKGPLIIQQYWNNDEADRKSLINGWLKTGDMVSCDEDGFIYIKDRMKDMVNRGGEKVFCIEVENILYNHPKVLEAAVVGVVDEVYGEAVKAVLVLKHNERITEEEIKEWCGKYLAKFKVPKYISVAGSLSRNAGGKVLKHKLK